MKYQAKSKEWFEFDCTKEVYDKFGFYPCQRVMTPKGRAIVIGQYRGDLWFHIDGDTGASYWSTFNSKHAFATGGFGPLYPNNFIEAVEHDDAELVASQMDEDHLRVKGREAALFEFILSYGNKDKILDMLCRQFHYISNGSLGFQTIVGSHIVKLSADGEDPANDKQVLDTLEILVRHGASVNKPSPRLEYPLHQCVKLSNYAGVKFLMKHKASLNSTNDYGETPVHLAAGQCNSDLLTCMHAELEGERSFQPNSSGNTDELTRSIQNLSIAPSMERLYLPREILALIFGFFCSMTERQTISLVCKYWRGVVESQWKNFFEMRWPDENFSVPEELQGLDWKSKVFKRARLEHGKLLRSDLMDIHRLLHQTKLVMKIAGKVVAPEFMGIGGYGFSRMRVPASIRKEHKKAGINTEEKCTCIATPGGNTILITGSHVYENWKDL